MAAEAHMLADKLGMGVNTDALNSEGLTRLVSDLRAKVRDANLETQADNPSAPSPDSVDVVKRVVSTDDVPPAGTVTHVAPPPNAEAKTALKANLVKDDEPEKPPYYMAEGKSITCLKGLLAPGDEVKASYFGGGEETLRKHVKNKFVIKS